MTDEQLRFAVESNGKYIPGILEPALNVEELTTPELEILAGSDDEQKNRFFIHHSSLENRYDKVVSHPESAQETILNDPDLYQWASRHREQEKAGFVSSFFRGLGDMAVGTFNLGRDIMAAQMTVAASPFTDLTAKEGVQQYADLAANAGGNLLLENNRLVAGVFGKGGLFDKASSWIASELVDEEGREILKTSQIERDRVFALESMEMGKMAQEFHTALGDILNEQVGIDLFGQTTPDPLAAEALGEFMSPDNWVAFMLGGIYKKTTREAAEAAMESVELGARIRVIESAGDRASKEAAESLAEMKLKKSQVDEILADRKRAMATAVQKLEEPGILRKTTGKAIAGTGRAIQKVGEGTTAAVDRLSNAASAMVGKEAVEVGSRVASVGSKGFTDFLKFATGGVIQNRGRDLSNLGDLFAIGATTMPFWRAYKAMSGTTKLGSAIATTADFLDLAEFTRLTVNATKGLAYGGAVGYGIGYAASAGDTDAAAAGAGGSGFFGATGGIHGTFRQVESKAQFIKEYAGTHRQYMEALSPLQRQEIESLPVESQKVIAYYGSVFPDVTFRMKPDSMSEAGAYFDPTTQEIVINSEAPGFDGVDVVRANAVHEIAHAMETHGMMADVDALLLGDMELQEPGIYTLRDDAGSPVIEDGAYVVNEEFKALKREYEALLGQERSNEQIVREIFAETVAGYLLEEGGLTFARDLKSGPLDDIVRRIGVLFEGSFADSPKMVQGVLGSMGTLFKKDGAIEEGTGVFAGKLKDHPKLKSMAREYVRKLSRTAEPGEIDKDAKRRTFTREQVVSNPNLLELFAANEELVYDEAGKIQFNPVTLEPLALTRSEMKARAAKRSEILLEEATKNTESSDPELLQRRQALDINGRTVTVYDGRYMSNEMLDTLESQDVLNPVQLKNLRIINDLLRESKESVSIASFYQAASTKLTGGRTSKKRSVSGRHRLDVVYGLSVSKDGNILLKTISMDTLSDNAQRFVASGKAKIWGGALKGLLDDVDIYLNNIASGREGAENLGAAKRDAIQNLLGIRTGRELVNPNPWHGTTKAPRTIHTSLRLDRMNKMRVRGRSYKWDQQANTRAKLNYRPDTEGSSFDKEGAPIDADETVSPALN